MNFKDLLLCAKAGNEAAVMEIVNMYRPLLMKESVLAGELDEDLYQELWLTLLNCIEKINL